MIFLGRPDAFARNILRHVLITVQYHQKSIALICIDRVSWKSRMHSSKELHPRTSNASDASLDVWSHLGLDRFETCPHIHLWKQGNKDGYPRSQNHSFSEFEFLSFGRPNSETLMKGLHWNSLAYRTETKVVEAKNMAQKRIGDEEEKSRVLQLEVQILKNLKRQSSWNTEKRNSQLHMLPGL